MDAYVLLATHGNVGPFFRSLVSQVTPGRRMWTFLVGPNGKRLGALADLFDPRVHAAAHRYRDTEKNAER